MSDNGKRNGRKFVVKNSRIQGRGVFASTRIRSGQRIIEYVGERISTEEADNRYVDDEMDRHHTFLFSVDDDICIDAAYKGNAARYINHSCEPNCEAVNEDGRIFIEAVKNIQPGVELTYDYQFEHEGKISKEDKKLYHCACGSAKCRSTILKVTRKKRT